MLNLLRKAANILANRPDSKERNWRLLKYGNGRYGKHFSIITANNFEKKQIDDLVLRNSINTNLVHCIKHVSYQVPTQLSIQEIRSKSLEIVLDETWSIYFFDEIDWAQIQLLR